MARSAALAFLCLFLLSCLPRPEIVAPVDGSQVPGDASTLDVTIDLGPALPFGAVLKVTLLSGIDTGSPVITDLSADFAGAGGTVTLTGLQDGSGPVREGRSTIFAAIDSDADGTAENVASATFSFVRGLDSADADRCDVLDPSHCLYPFPSSHFLKPDPATDTGLRVSFPPASMPVNDLGTPVDPTEWNRSDGFSPGAAMHAVFPDIDFAQSGLPDMANIGLSLDPDAAVVLIDAETGERWPYFSELDFDATGNPARQALFVRPARNFKGGHRYVVGFRNLKDAAGDLLDPSPGFRLYRDGLVTEVDAIESRRPEIESAITALEQAGVDRDELQLAYDFTILSKRDLSERILKMRDDAFAFLGTDAPAFTVTEVQDRERNGVPLKRIDGTYEVPLYLTGDGIPFFSRLTQGPDGLPIRVGTYTADFRCTVPSTATPATRGRPSLYGHGLLGSQNETGASHVEVFATTHNIIFCGTRWIGMGEDDSLGTAAILQDFSNFPVLVDRLHQANLNFLFLGRLMIHPDGLRTDPSFGDIFDCDWPLAPGEERCLFYDGNSQGGIAGGGLAAIAQDFDRLVLGVVGMNYSTLLRRSVDFDPFKAIIGYTDPLDINLVIHMAQMLWDRTEANGAANHLTSDTFDGTPAKDVLLHVAWNDLQVAQITAETMARTMGARVRFPAFDPARFVGEASPGDGTTITTPRAWDEQFPYFEIPRLESTVPDQDHGKGSVLVVWDSGNVQPPLDNQPPPRIFNPALQPCARGRGTDPHECPRRDPLSLDQKSAFMTPGGTFIDTCPVGESCTARGN